MYLGRALCGDGKTEKDVDLGLRRRGGQHYVPRFLCSPVPMFPEPMFPGTYVPRYRCSPVPMFPDLCTLIVDFSINR